MTTRIKIIPCYGCACYEQWEKEINDFLASVDGFPAKVDFVNFGTMLYAIITHEDV